MRLKHLDFMVPCGRCQLCKKTRLDSWTLRLVHESSYYQEVAFVTLTYSDDLLPLGLCGRGTLSRSDLQKFFKRLRKNLGPSRKIKYYACGEYGKTTFRPHYHAIIFGCADYQIISKSWNKGFIQVRPFDVCHVRYITKYILKTPTVSKTIRAFKIHGLEPPFKLQSTALGRQYAEDSQDSIRRNLYITLNGYRKPVPRYYRKKLFITADDYESIRLDNSLALYSSLLPFARFNWLDLRLGLDGYTPNFLSSPAFSVPYLDILRLRDRTITQLSTHAIFKKI